MTMQGAISFIQRLKRIASGAISLSGNIIRKISVSDAVSGVVSFVGSVIHKERKIPSGSISMPGALTYLLFLKSAFINALDFSKNLARKAFQKRVPSGTLNFSPTVTGKKGPYWLVGHVLYRLISAGTSLVGTLELSGTLIRRVFVKKAYDGTLTLSGVAAKLRRIIIVGTIGFNSSINRFGTFLRRSPGNEIRFSGNLSRYQRPKVTIEGVLNLYKEIIIDGVRFRRITGALDSLEFIKTLSYDYRALGIVSRSKSGSMNLSGITRWEARTPLYFGIPNP